MTASQNGKEWNHNIHYHGLIMAAIPAGCQRALDVGCGEGMLARKLASHVPHVVGIDQHAASIDQARHQNVGGQIEYVLGDFVTYPFEPASFGLITCLAALHHMDAAALTRMKLLLAPGGTLIINGLARSQLPDLPMDAVAIIANLGYRLTRTCWNHPSPVIWPPPHNYRQIRALARELLPGARYQRLLLWRYSITWVKDNPG